MQITRLPSRHLGASELVDCSHACPVCLSDAPRPRVVRVQADPDVYMLACSRCQASSASHMPRADALAGYYADFYSGFGREVTFSNAARFARHVIRRLPSDAFGSTARILDYGGGDGSLSRAIAERLLTLGRTSRAEIVVVDVASHQDVTHRNVSMRFQSPAEAPGGPHDLVLASAVLEHVPDLHRLLPALLDALPAGGLFYARTPYSIPLTKLLPALDLGYPAHVHDLGIPFWHCAQETFARPVRLLASRPSLVAGSLTRDPLRAIAAFAVKLPAHIETLLSPGDRKARFWQFVGGWEVLLQRV
jgi:hypothetical protein